MSDARHPVPGPVAPESLTAAAASLCCRFGEPELEAERRGCIRGLLRSSRAFALALDRFVGNATPHARGEHSTSDMQADVDSLSQALADWSFAVNASATTYRAYHAEIATAHRGMPVVLGARRVGLSDDARPEVDSGPPG